VSVGPPAGAARSATRRPLIARITIHLGTPERLEPAISKATPLGALWYRGPRVPGCHLLPRPRPALRALADALVEAADLADAYDADPFNGREQAERDPDR
jgi:hypothetical protein